MKNIIVKLKNKLASKGPRVKLKNFIKDLEKLTDDSRIILAGSIRRGLSEVGDFDIVSDYSYDEIIKKIKKIKYPEYKILGKGKKFIKLSLTNKNGIIEGQIKLVKPEELATALFFLTGSYKFNLKMRGRAKYMKKRLNEYGIKDLKTGKVKTFNSEEEIFKELKLKYIEPKDRE